MATEMSGSFGYSYSLSAWDGEIRDVVSVLIYIKDKQNEIEVLMCENQGVLCLPRKEVTADDTCQGSSGLGTLADPSGHVAGPEATPTSSQALLWPKDVSYSHVASSLALNLTGGSSSQFSTPQLVLLTRIYVPSLHKHYHHCVFAVNVVENQWKLLSNRDGQKRLTFNELRSTPYIQLERRDIIVVAEHVKKQFTGKGFCVGAIVREIGPHQVWRQVDVNQRTPDDALLRSPGYREQDIELLYEEFIRCSYPHGTVCFLDMKQLISDLGWKDKEKNIFRTLDRHRGGELGPKEFILGLAAMDPMTSHGKGPAEIRCRYIFKYYDKNEDDNMEFHEVKEMIQDIAQVQGQETTEEVLKEKTEKALETFGVAGESKVPLVNFLVAVGNLRFRGTSVLFRASMSVISHIVHKYGLTRRKEARSPFRSPASPGQDTKRLKRKSLMGLEKDVVKNCSSGYNEALDKDCVDQDMVMLSVCNTSQASIPLSDGAFQSPDSSNYTLAQHTVKVRRSGQITDIHLLLDMERAGEVCDTGFDVDEVSCDPNGDTRSTKDCHLISPKPSQLRNRMIDRFQSVEAFNLRSLPNEMVTALRFFEHEKHNKPSLDWGEVDMVKLGQYITSLCCATKELFENESRLLWLSTPCYILGDLHGNYRDLVCFEKALWRVGPHLTPANFLFLGDYVDRGDFGIEVVSYLFAQKLQAPSKFFLLRGNHEVRDIQQMFTFKEECVRKFGERLGISVWNAVNDVFDCMPLAAVVDKKIFCIHGGIPKLDGNLNELDKIPCPLPNPEAQSNLAWQMMWNDPVAAEDMNDTIQGQLAQNRGFAYNEKRQTACVFNRSAFDSFLQKNGLTHVVRAHEVKQAGFEIQQGGRLMTVFSSSHYCGGSNEAACILVHNYRMRVIRIDTT
ncbi:uncharacterized protein [Panulirus ornatus]|uniref:uncharacterized protein isoform X2 n=1 Tax=Panulirus ornatus TaxID=150431 RepID=UPI003A8860D7